MSKIKQLILWLIGLQIICYGLGLITQENLSPWYSSLSKSLLTPPGYVFGIAWSILYVLLAIVAWQLTQPCRLSHIVKMRIVFFIQLILNWIWTPIFFHHHAVILAFLCLCSIVLLMTYFMYLSWQQFRYLFWLMLPYWIWVCFASYLNFIICYQN